MKLILTQDVKGQGKAGDLINVSEGYARNFLLPRKLAVEATPQALQEVEAKKEAQKRKEAEDLAAAKEYAKKLEDLTVRVPAHTGDGGRLFGAITSKHIGDAMAKMGYDIDRRKIHLVEPIKTLGGHRVQIKVYPEVTATITVQVVAEA